jgi:hypothetical protein
MSAQSNEDFEIEIKRENSVMRNPKMPVQTKKPEKNILDAKI